jgi:thioredoxin-like negative regulator of GroEL
MKDRFGVRVPVSEDPAVKAVEALHVKEIAGKDFESEVVGSALPVALHFYGSESKACETLAPRFAAVAEKLSGKVRFLKVLRLANAQLAKTLDVSGSPTVLFFSGGREHGARLSGEDIKRTDLKARVEALLPAGAPVAAPSAAPAT